VSTDAREVVLTRIRDALEGAAARPPADLPDPRTPSHLSNQQSRIDRLVERVTEYRAHAEVVPAAGLSDAIRRRLDEAGAKRVAIAPDLPEDLRAAVGDRAIIDSGLTPRELDEIDAAVTTCALAVADTGTIVLNSGPGQGRRALTLVPDHHICIVRADQIVASVAEAIDLLDPTRPTTLISGPSATSDIELSRVEGVHGPRHLAVLIASANGRVSRRGRSRPTPAP
jgi:L-lactate dehydrogenase complex protein LldG